MIAMRMARVLIAYARRALARMSVMAAAPQPDMEE
jgi:hypothetical protein